MSSQANSTRLAAAGTSSQALRPWRNPNQPFPDAWVKPLYQQMEGLLLQDSRLHQRSTVGKAADYQVMVGAGMAMMLTQAELQKAPDAKALQQLRDTGADALRTLFKADPQQVGFDGLPVAV